MTQSTIKETYNATTNSNALHYLVREPKVHSDKRKAIVLLHGVGSNEADLFSLADQLPEDFLIISPRGQFTLGSGRYAWYNVDFSTGKPVLDALQERSSREVITIFIRQVKKMYNLDALYLGGFSQGAIMSYSIGLTNPAEVKGIVSLSGRILEEIKPLVNKDGNLQQLKVFVAHGEQDNTLPVHYARTAKDYLESLAVQLTYKEYQTGHQINNNVLRDLNNWLE